MAAILVALVAAVASAALVEEVVVGLLLLILLGVHVPTAHERHWLASGEWVRNVAWVVVAAVVATALFAVGYLAARVLTDPVWIGALAHVFATLVGGLALWLLCPADQPPGR